MIWLKFVLLVVAILVRHVCQCTPEVQFTHKFVGPHKGDLFGWTIVTTRGRLIVSAPSDNHGKGTVYVGHQIKIDSPDVVGDARGFGLHVDTNKEFVVVSGYKHPAIYVYQANELYELKASIPVDHTIIHGVVIGDGNTIAAVGQELQSDTCYVTIYSYDGHSSWHLEHKFYLGVRRDDDIPLNVMAMSGVTLAVGNDGDHGEKGRVELYRNVRGVWSKTQTLVPPEEHIEYFGWFIAMEGDHLVVSAQQERQSIVFTYIFDHSTGVWVNTGRLLPPGGDSVAIKDNVLVATVNDDDTHKEVCGVVYKLSSKYKNVWEEFAILKTNGQPLKDRMTFNIGISTQDGLVYTGRVPLLGDGDSMVFVHNITKLPSEVEN